ncbi:hypothetical protein WN48_00043 [Eufriesea mexicana]|nr:hypothetical protein WN48_00043 [Eufriesea mexicana]
MLHILSEAIIVIKNKENKRYMQFNTDTLLVPWLRKRFDSSRPYAAKNDRKLTAKSQESTNAWPAIAVNCFILVPEIGEALGQKAECDKRVEVYGCVMCLKDLDRPSEQERKPEYERRQNEWWKSDFSDVWNSVRNKNKAEDEEGEDPLVSSRAPSDRTSSHGRPARGGKHGGESKKEMAKGKRQTTKSISIKSNLYFTVSSLFIELGGTLREH